DVSGQGLGYTGEGNYCGGTYGGRGGNYSVAQQSGATYGNWLTPTNFGSGGYNLSSSLGGGRMRVRAGELILDGSLLANGVTHPTIAHRGGGSGGSIWLEAGVLRGTGLVQADGSSGSSTYGCGGGGGRVAVYYTDASGFDLAHVEAQGGIGASGQQDGGAGTVYLKDAAAVAGTLLIDNAGHEDAAQTELSEDVPGTLAIRNASVVLSGSQTIGYLVATNAVVTQEGHESVTTVDLTGGHYTQHGALTVTDFSLVDGGYEQNGVLTISNSYANIGTSTVIRSAEFSIPGDGNLDLPEGQILELNVPSDIWDTARIEGRLLLNAPYEFTHLTVTNGGLISHGAGLEEGLHLTVTESLLIGADGSVDLTACGREGLGVATYCGGSYGGHGGEYPGLFSNPTYGDYLTPTNLGTGGYTADQARGGGSAYISAGSLTLDGSILANGGVWSVVNSSRGGGSGGSIWLDLGVLRGDGWIRANGGYGQAMQGCAGGGGRIAVYYNELGGFDLEHLEARGGSGHYADGEDGTVHQEHVLGPVRVLSMSPSGVGGTTCEDIQIKFSTGIDTSSFSVVDIDVSTPVEHRMPSSIQQIDTVTFLIRFSPPLDEEGAYEVAIGPDIMTSNGYGMDQDDDGTDSEPIDDVFHGSFEIDYTAPVSPSVINYPMLPSTSDVNVTSLTLQGTRADDSSVLIDGVERVSLGSGIWQTSLTLVQGVNAFALTSKDAVGNESAQSHVRFFVDSIAPVVNGVTPPNNAFTNSPPSHILFTQSENGTELDLSSSALSVKKGGLMDVPGSWTINGNQLSFTPNSTLSDGVYNLKIRLLDKFGNQSAEFNSVFTVDTALPMIPTINPVTSPTVIGHQVIGGQREAYTEIWMDDVRIVPVSSSTSWSYDIPLSDGITVLTFKAIDRAGNRSGSNVVSIVYDDTAPGHVSVTAEGAGEGTEVALSWADYDEVANGDDIDHYAIYRSSSYFTNLSAALAIGTRAAGIKNFTATGLTRDTTYYFGVVAEDTQGNQRNHIGEPVMVRTVDNLPPANPSALHFDCFRSNLVVNWTPSINSEGDLAAYKVYVAGSTNGVVLDQSASSYDVGNGLLPATAYVFRVSSVDADGNESGGAVVTGVTLLPNPTNVVADPYDSVVTLTWAPALPAQYVKHYRIYHAATNFMTVSNLTGSITISGTEGGVAGLQNGAEHSFAVVTVNLSDGQDDEVASVSAMPMLDTNGPAVSSIKFGDEELTAGMIVTKENYLRVTASDPAGMSRVEFRVDGTNLYTATGSSESYSYYWTVPLFADGLHKLVFRAYDSKENATVITNSVYVNLGAPTQAPSITSPAEGASVNTPSAILLGTAAKYTDVVLFKGGVLSASPAASVQGNGTWSTGLTLTEGTNYIQAACVNRGGQGPLSAGRNIVLDTSIPSAPVNLTGLPRESGTIRVTWNKPNNKTIQGYYVYRSASAFTEKGQATRLNSTLLGSTTYDDTPTADGTYYYRVSLVNQAGTESPLSAMVWEESDRTPPRASSIVISPRGNHDSGTGRTAPGLVDVTVHVTESLSATPFLSVTPQDGFPISVVLSKVNNFAYSGYFTVLPHTPSGAAALVFSARDEAGNRGTGIDSVPALIIDTDGPEVVQLAIQPAAPIQNSSTNPVTVTFTMVLDDSVANGTEPALSYLLSEHTNGWIAITNTVKITAVSWSGMFTLPATAGETTELLTFAYIGEDDLGNLGMEISATKEFEVYQGDLPGLASPLGLKVESQPGGKINLSWQSTQDAADYQIYRQAPGEGSLTELARSGGALNLLDVPAIEGIYHYAVASIRQENGQETIGAMSATVSALSDATVPGIPTNVTLEMVGNGIKISWEPPENTEAMTYTIYRSSGTVITNVDALSPIGADVQQLFVVDPQPSKDEHAYTVTAVDSVGNESGPAVSMYLNFTLLPVNSLEALVSNSDYPVLIWSHPYPGDVMGYDLYLVEGANTTKLNTSLLTAVTYTDTGYTGQEREYMVISVDSEWQESVGRRLRLPIVSALPHADMEVKRGIMNRLSFDVINETTSSVNNVQLKVQVGSQQNASSSFNLSAGATQAADVVIGGKSDLLNVSAFKTTIEIVPNAGEKITIIEDSSIVVGDDLLSVDVLNGTFLRGGDGEVQWVLRNTSDEEVEVVTAKNDGSQPSVDVRFRLLDADNNVYSVASFKQGHGEGIVALANGDVVARIPAGGEFISDVAVINVPTNVLDQMYVKLEIDRIYYHLGRQDEQWIQGLNQSRAVAVVDTPYSVSVTNVAPRSSVGNEPIIVTGHAVSRETGLPKVNAPLDLAVSVRGFERHYDLWTDLNGGFSHTFEPMPGESGQYRVWAVHPDLNDKPVQDSFTINRVVVSPALYNVKYPILTTQALNVDVTTGEGTAVNNLHLEYLSEDQPAAIAPTGVFVTIGSPIDTLASKKQARLSFDLRGTDEAAPVGAIYLRVVSDESPDYWAKVSVNYEFTQPTPKLFYSPSYVELGLAYDELQARTITLENKGQGTLEGIDVVLTGAGGAAVPSWVTMALDTTKTNLAPGEVLPVKVSFRPDSGVAQGDYTFFMTVASDNYTTRNIGLYVTVTQAGIGSALFKVVDIYTGTLDVNGDILQGLKDARITLQNEEVLSIEETLNTDSFGEALFSDMPAGRYKVRITANNHNSYIGRIWIHSGLTETHEVAMDYNLVSIEWEVREITIEDRYQIVLTATYETDVPAPVLVVEPSSINLPNMEPGDVYNGEIRITNHGLIRADDLLIRFPGTDSYFKYEYLVGLPDHLNAKAFLVIPYRVTCLQSLKNQIGADVYTGCGTVSYNFESASHRQFSKNTRWCWIGLAPLGG
ncbi:MAG: hypothetical protein KJ626_10905, partial [Verrucomicrobia bacterium]|nr:hypothetical protein [Verrucomicrobiota bacterium]